MTIEDDTVVHGALRGLAVVRPGRTLRISRHGVRQGLTHVADGAILDVDGVVQGAIYVEPGGTVKIAGRAEGAIHNDGRLVISGAHRGAWGGAGEIEVDATADLSHSVRKSRVRVRNAALTPGR